MFFENETGTVYYEVHGPESAPAILFSHGVAMDNKTFELQIEALQHKYRVIVWDMPCHGRSSTINKNLRYSTTAGDFIVAILDELNIHRAVLAGLSLGSLVVQQVACRYPERVKAAVHISGGPLYPKYSSVLKLSIPFIWFMLKLYPAKSLYKAFATHKALTENTRAYLTETASQTGKDVIIHLTNEMVRDMVTGLPELPQQPALMVCGDHDLRFIHKMAEKWHNILPQSQLVLIQHAHHILNQDNPEEFNKVLLNFLEQITDQ